MQDNVSGKFHRFSPEAYLIIGKLNGEKDLQIIWEEACQILGDNMPSQDEVIELVSKLFTANVLRCDVMPDVEVISRRRKTQERQKLLQKVKSPLALRFPLIDPERFIERTKGLGNLVFSGWAALVWALLLTLALVLAVINWEALSNNLSDRVLFVENMVLLALIYPLVKLLHEFGHAYAVKRWGGEVHEMGLMFLVFFPVPYVDASASISFANKYQRMLVGAAGIMVEVFLASLAMVVWTLSEPGLARSLAFNTMLVAGVSTILFNGNPLLKFDAYYVLGDYLEIPNFSNKANEFVFYWLKRFVMGVRGLTSPSATKKEAMWLALYATTSYVYRLFVMLTIALFIATEYPFVGVLLAFLSIYNALLKPLGTLMLKPFKDPVLMLRPYRTWAVLGSAMLVLVLLLFVIPFRHSSYSNGVITGNESTQIRVPEAGFVEAVVAKPGQHLQAGEVILRLNDPALKTQVLAMAEQVKEVKARVNASFNDRVELSIQKDLLQVRQLEYQKMVRRQQLLVIRAHNSGVLVLPNYHELMGRFVARGSWIGDVAEASKLPIHVYVGEDQIEQVRHRTVSVRVRPASSFDQSYLASIETIVPAATFALPSSILSTDGGGLIAAKTASNGRPAEAYRRHFKLALSVDHNDKIRLNERVHVVFEHQAEPLAWRIFRGFRRVFLRQLDV